MIINILEKSNSATYIRAIHTFIHRDKATEIRISETHQRFEFIDLSNAQETIRPEGTCHTNRFKTLEEAMARAEETYINRYGEDE